MENIKENNNDLACLKMPVSFSSRRVYMRKNLSMQKMVLAEADIKAGIKGRCDKAKADYESVLRAVSHKIGASDGP